MSLAIRTALIFLLVLWAALVPASAQQPTAADDVSKGHYLAVMICATCHVAAPDQPYPPILKPPAPPFASIMQRKDVTEASLTKFVATTHRGLDNPQGMPNPDLADYQIKQVVAYLMSLRK